VTRHRIRRRRRAQCCTRSCSQTVDTGTHEFEISFHNVNWFWPQKTSNLVGLRRARGRGEMPALRLPGTGPAAVRVNSPLEFLNIASERRIRMGRFWNCVAGTNGRLLEGTCTTPRDVRAIPTGFGQERDALSDPGVAVDVLSVHDFPIGGACNRVGEENCRNPALFLRQLEVRNFDTNLDGNVRGERRVRYGVPSDVCNDRVEVRWTVRWSTCCARERSSADTKRVRRTDSEASVGLSNSVPSQSREQPAMRSAWTGNSMAIRTDAMLNYEGCRLIMLEVVVDRSTS